MCSLRGAGPIDKVLSALFDECWMETLMNLR
jgi:hypothetical protein